MPKQILNPFKLIILYKRLILVKITNIRG